MATTAELLTHGWQCQQSGDVAQAERVYRHVLQVDPGQPSAWRLLADLCVAQHRLAESIELYQESLRLAPQQAITHYNLGNTFFRLGRLPEAEACYRQALACKPDYAQAHNNLGVTLIEQSRCEEAVACYRRAVRLQPDYAEAFLNLANAYKIDGRLDLAIACYRRSVELQPDNAVFHSYLLFALNYHPAYSPQAIFEEHLNWARRHGGNEKGTRIFSPIVAAVLDDSLDGEKKSVPFSLPFFPPDRRLRLGFVSADFRRHVMGYFSEAVLRALDRRRFEVFCYANVAWEDDLTRRIEALADGYRSISALSDDQATETIRRDKIDILIDLSGHTGGNRLPVFARKPAPIQVAHFGYQGSTGLAAMDYRISDPYADPPGMTEPYHTEQLLRLPESLWCYPPPVSPAPGPLPASQTGYVTFGSFNGLAKITADVIAAWARILSRVPGSRLTILTGVGPRTDERILDAFALQGVSARRLTLLKRAERGGYFELFRQADIALDPFPYTGCNTTVDALWMGVPVITLAGSTCFSRQSVGPLTLLGLADLVASSQDDYMETAVRLAGDVERLSELRGSLRERMRQSPLTNVQRLYPATGGGLLVGLAIACGEMPVTTLLVAACARIRLRAIGGS